MGGAVGGAPRELQRKQGLGGGSQFEEMNEEMNEEMKK